MKQILQNMESGRIYVQDVPLSHPAPNQVLVRNAFSVVSLGTERVKVQTGEKTLLGKALARPDQVQLVLQKIRQEGLLSTWRKVKDRLSAPAPLGYSCAGIVIETGSDVRSFQKGDRVACAGAQAAFHAEVVAVSVQLCALVPPDVDLASASTATLGAIALQGVRQADIRLGETVVVIGLGFLGQLTQQILRGAGARVFGIDLDTRKIELAKTLGMEAGGVWGQEDLLSTLQAFSNNFGADAVLLTASSSSPDLVRFAAQCARDRGRIVIVGDVPVDVPRSPFYEKELSVYFSRSYGPGRYDPLYEDHGIDYPVGYVRWTENRNMQAYLELLRKGDVRIPPLLTHRYPIEQAPEAFQKIAHPENEFLVGMLLEYPADAPVVSKPPARREAAAPVAGQVGIGMIGAGHFGTSVLLPSLRAQAGIVLETICTSHGYTARAAADKFKFSQATCDPKDVFSNSSIQAVVIATRHDTHAPLVLAALEAGKRVFVEKPLCLTLDELEQIVEAQHRTNLPVMVGFNRRFAPATAWALADLENLADPRMIHYRINAGPLQADNWLKDPLQGGGRLRGELCHFLDLVTAFVHSRPRQVYAQGLDGSQSEDVAVQLSFEDGSQAQILYTSLGQSSLPKERLEIFCAGHALVLDNFQTLTIHSPQKRRRYRTWSQDKGYRQEIESWTKSLREGGESPIPFSQIVQSAHLTFLVIESLLKGVPVPVPALHE